MKIVFFGSGPFGLPTLDRLHALSARYPLLRVVTRPDRPQKRGRKLAPTPIRQRASELGVPCEAPTSVNDPAFLDELLALEADLFLVADYGEMLRKRLRQLPKIGVFNLHASLLPAYRGAAPVVHALFAGEKETGVTLFRIEKGLDSGPVVDAIALAVEPLESAGELEDRLAHVAADLLERNLEAFATGSFKESPQDETAATLAPKLTKRCGIIDWDKTAVEITHFVRALSPWPGGFSFLRKSADPGVRQERTVFLRVQPASDSPLQVPGDPPGVPGAVDRVGSEGFSVYCGSGSVEVLEIQREGKGALPAAAYLRGRRLQHGDRFGPAEDRP